MPVFFSLPSLQRHGIAGFWTGKLRRIVLPWVVGVLFLAPPTMYMILLSRGKAPGYFAFWTGPFWHGFYSQSVFWFLGVLTLFYLILTGCFICFSVLRRPAGVPQKKLLLLPAGVVVLGSAFFLGLNRFFPVDTWVTDLYVIVFQPLRLPLYFIYFWLGVLAWKRSWFSENGFRPRWIPWTVLCVGAACLYLYFKFLMRAKGGELAVQAGNALGFNLFAFSFLLSGAALFKALFDSGKPLWRSLASSSYGIYYFHSIVVFYGAYFLLQVRASAYGKAVFLTGASLVVCWGTTVLLKKNRLAATVL